MRKVLGRQLGDPVWRDRARERRLARGKSFGVAIYRRAAREDQALELASFQLLEKPLGGDDVVARVAVELVAPAWPHAGLAGQVIDDVGAFERGSEVGVHQVQLFE